MIQTPVTHQYAGETREKPDRQAARLARSRSCQNRQAANRNTLFFQTLSLSHHASVCKALFLSDVFCHPSVMLPFHKLCSINSRRFRVGIKKRVPANQHWETLYTQLQFYFVLFSWPYVTGPVVGMCGDGDGRSMRRGERPHWGAVKLSTSRTTGLWSKAAWFMGYGLPHWEETIQFPYEDTAVVAARTHASSCSVTVVHQKYPHYFLWMEMF